MFLYLSSHSLRADAMHGWAPRLQTDTQAIPLNTIYPIQTQAQEYKLWDRGQRSDIRGSCELPLEASLSGQGKHAEHQRDNKSIALNSTPYLRKCLLPLSTLRPIPPSNGHFSLRELHAVLFFPRDIRLSSRVTAIFAALSRRARRGRNKGALCSDN